MVLVATTIAASKQLVGIAPALLSAHVLRQKHALSSAVKNVDNAVPATAYPQPLNFHGVVAGAGEVQQLAGNVAGVW